MCKSLVDTRDALQQMVSTPNWTKWRNAGSADFRATCDEVRSCIMDERGFWAAIEELLDLLDPSISFLKMVDGQTPVMGKVFYKAWKVSDGSMLLLYMSLHFTMTHTLHQVNANTLNLPHKYSHFFYQFTVCGMQVKKSIDDYVERKKASEQAQGRYFPLFTDEEMESLTALWERKWEMFHNPLHALAYVLDPEYFCCQDLAGDMYMTGEIRKALDALCQDLEERAIMESEILLMRIKHRSNELLERLGSKLPAHMLWSETYINDTLKPLAMRLLSQVVSSSASERCWSNYSFIHSDRR